MRDAVHTGPARDTHSMAAAASFGRAASVQAELLRDNQHPEACHRHAELHEHESSGDDFRSRIACEEETESRTADQLEASPNRQRPPCCNDADDWDLDYFGEESNRDKRLGNGGLVGDERTRMYDEASSGGRSSRSSSLDRLSGMTRDDSVDTLTVDKVADLGPLRPTLSHEDFLAKPYHDTEDYIEFDQFDVSGDCTAVQPTRNDNLIQLAVQATPSLAVSVLGEMLAGWLLGVVQHWPVFVKINEIFILVPILLNLKGNLEMNLAARLTTVANAGLLDRSRSRGTLVAGNLSLLQLQSLVIGAAAGMFSFVLGAASRPHPSSWSEVALLVTSSMGCAAISSFILGLFMCALIICSRRLNINPANIATPIGAALGDVVTLVVLVLCSNTLLYMSTPLRSVLLAGMVVCIPVWITLIYRNEYAKHLIDAGWIPIFAAMVISSFSGLILERFIEADAGMALLAPVFNGVAGNVGSILASRISSALHAGSKEASADARIVLFMLSVPTHAGFLLVTHLLGIGNMHVDLLFFVLYMAASLVLSAVMLVLAEWLTLAFWRRGCDPDNCVLPLLTAFGDVLGTALLVLVFAVYKIFIPTVAASVAPVAPTLRARAIWM